MTLNEKCISVSKAVTDISLRSKSTKTALIATIWTAKMHILSHAVIEELSVWRSECFPPVNNFHNAVS